jgi:hypothetical protein
MGACPSFLYIPALVWRMDPIAAFDEVEASLDGVRVV